MATPIRHQNSLFGSYVGSTPQVTYSPSVFSYTFFDTLPWLLTPLAWVQSTKQNHMQKHTNVSPVKLSVALDKVPAGSINAFAFYSHSSFLPNQCIILSEEEIQMSQNRY